MKKLLATLHYFKHQRTAATGVEYALMAAGISLTIMFAVFFFGDTIQATFANMFEVLADYLQTA
jgi:Flp pilus assembly pilin Flp